MTKLPRRSRKKSTEIDPSKIGKLIRLLSSDKPGEVAAAAAALTRLLQAGGRDWHDVADLVEAGLRPEQPRNLPERTWGPPSPRADDWQSMCWFAFHHRFDLRPCDREFIEDCLLGRFDDGVVTEWHLQELRRIVAGIKTTAA